MSPTLKIFACKSRRPLFAGVFAAIMLLAACQPEPKTQQPPVVPAIVQRHAHAQRYAVDPARSTIVLHVYRDGPLARFGHNHVIAVTRLQGTVFREADMRQSEVDLSFPVAALNIDAPADRADAGMDFPGVLSPEAIAETREHMLGPQLLAGMQYPKITLRSIAVSGRWPELQLVVEVNLRRCLSQILLPVHMTELDNTLIADGTTRLSQVQLGLTPYSVLGGGLRVRDTIDVHFHIVAVRAVQEP